MNASALSKLYNWSYFCGDPQLDVWINSDFGHCFRSLCLEVPIYALFAAFNAYYLGNLGSTFARSTSQLRILTLRSILTTLLLLYPVTVILDKHFVHFEQVILSDYIWLITQIILWALHLVYLYVLRTRLCHSSRGPVLIVFGWILTIVPTSFAVRTGLIQHIYLNNFDVYLCFINAVIQALYLVTLIPKGDAREATWLTQTRLGNFINGSDSRPIVAESLTTSCASLPAAPPLAEPVQPHFISRLVLSWVNPLLARGSQQNVTSIDDVFELPARLKTTFIDTKFWIVFRNLQMKQAISSLQRTGIVSAAKISVLRVIIATFGVEYFSLGILKLINDASDFAGPLLLNLLVNFVDSKSTSENEYEGYYLAAGLCGASLLSSFINVHYSFMLYNVGLKIRTALISTIYRKTLHLRSSAMADFSIGEVVNFMSTDTDRVVNIFTSFHEFWSMPIKIAICLFLLHQQVGVAYLAGVGFAIVLIPINHFIANAIVRFNKSMMDTKDKRVKLMTEVLFGIRAIKLYSWEEYLMKKILNLRNLEVVSLKKIKYLDAFCVFFWAMTPLIIAVLTFSVFILLGNVLTVSKVFTCLALFNMLMGPLNAFPWVLGGVVQGWVSVKRLQKIFKVEEVKLDKSYVNLDDTSPTALYIRNGHFTWSSADETSSTAFTLKNINFEAQTGQLIGVCGPAGCGKTTLLLAILSEVNCTGGEVGTTCVADGFAYVSQDPWIQNCSIRDNILFGRPANLELYRRVVQACALDEDFKVFPTGDDTMVGDRGITLSGGQKTRIGLARAIYQDKDVYLIDDVLSSLDSHVSQHVMTYSIKGLLGEKTRILCTHHVKYLMNADHVILMKNGEITEQGEPKSVLCGEFAELRTTHSTDLNDDKTLSKHSKSIDSVSVDSHSVADGLANEELMEHGNLKGKVYRLYCAKIGSVVTIVILLSLLLMQASRNFNDWWLAYWLAHSTNSSNSPAYKHSYRTFKEMEEDNYMFYLTVYLIIAGATGLFTIVRSFSFAYGGIRAAVQLHSDILQAIMKATVTFFDVTPVGRIINRISSDTYTIDENLPFVLNILLAQSFGLAGVLFIISFSVPWLLLLLIPLAAMYIYVQQYYRHTSRELRRIDAITLSPIYAHFSESVLGLVTIRSFRYESKFKKENEGRLERNQRVKFSLTATSKWLSLRLQLIGTAVITGIAVIAVAEHQIHGINPGLVGLALSYGLSITIMLSTVVQFFTETEKEMVGVERTLQYIEDLEPERWDGFIKPHPHWPDEGVITFQNVILRYRQHQQPSLNSLTFSTFPREKIGIAGRTGAGKSSIFTAFLRLVELEKGGITVDGITVAYLDLQDLRRNVAVIPQDPFLFSGSIRNNLDPSDQYSDDELWNALERCHMSEVISRIGGLSSVLAERGADLSCGQRQLLCLARAVLSKTKILCIDEATANIDHETDRMVQKTIRTVFNDSTVLTIAHRLETIVDSDRILVMDGGRMVEFDTPQALLSDANSLFYQLMHEQEYVR
ncbi:Multidrug resistance-associated protein 7 [Chamberlinius hualienensis]